MLLLREGKARELIDIIPRRGPKVQIDILYFSLTNIPYKTSPEYSTLFQ